MLKIERLDTRRVFSRRPCFIRSVVWKSKTVYVGIYVQSRWVPFNSHPDPEGSTSPAPTGWSEKTPNSRGAWGLSPDSNFLISPIHSCGYDLINLFVSGNLLSLISLMELQSKEVWVIKCIKCQGQPGKSVFVLAHCHAIVYCQFNPAFRPALVSLVHGDQALGSFH